MSTVVEVFSFLLNHFPVLHVGLRFMSLKYDFQYAKSFTDSFFPNYFKSRKDI